MGACSTTDGVALAPHLLLHTAVLLYVPITARDDICISSLCKRADIACFETFHAKTSASEIVAPRSNESVGYAKQGRESDTILGTSLLFLLVPIILILRDVQTCLAHPVFVSAALAVELVQQHQQILLLLLALLSLFLGSLQLLSERRDL